MFLTENENLKNSIKVMCGISEDNFRESNKFSDRKSIEFDIKNSLKADKAKIVEYMKNKFILQLHKNNKLIYEGVIKEEEFKDIFQEKTGIYLDLYL